MSLSGRVLVKARVTDNCLSDIEVNSLRPALAQKLVQGKPLPEAANTISQCYIVCKQAQSLAASLAVNQKTPSHDQLVRIQLEAIDQTLWRWMVDLPKLVSISTQLPEYAKIKQQIFQWQMRSFSSDRPVGNQVSANLDIVNLWFSDLIGVSASLWCKYSPEQLIDWIKSDSIAARIIQKSIELIPTPGNTESIEVQHYTDQLKHLERPLWINETIKKVTHPSTLETDFFNQAIHLWSIPVIQLLSRLRQFANSVNELLSGNIVSEFGFEAKDEQILTWVMTARGWLLHNITINKDKSEPNQVSVSDYQILSPTDSHFCQSGQVEKVLSQLRFSDPKQIESILELVILASDPCVEYKIEIEHA